MSLSQEKPKSVNQIRGHITPVTDHRIRPWYKKGAFSSLPQEILDTRGGFGIIPYLNTRSKLDLLFDRTLREEKERCTSFEGSHSRNNIRERTEQKIVEICHDFDPNAFIAAGVGDLAETHQWLSGLNKDHPWLRNSLLAIRQNALALPPILAALSTSTLLNGGMNLHDTVIAAGGLALNTAASLAFTQGESLRRPVTPDPIHFRLAAAVALTQDIDRFNSRVRAAIGERPNGEKSTSNLIEGTLVVGTGLNTESIANDDEMLFTPNRESTKRQKFMNRERSFIFQEVLTDPKIGLKLLATYMYNNQIYQQKVLKKLPEELQEELRQMSNKSAIANSDPDVSGDPNSQMITQALEEIELPEMMQLLLNVAQSKRNGMRVLMTDKNTQGGFTTLRSGMMESLTAKMNIPLVGAILALRNELPPQLVTSKLINDFGRVIPPVSSKEATAGGIILPERLSSNEIEYTKAANVAAWNAMRIFIVLMKSRGMNDAQRDTIFLRIKEIWKKRKAFKEGIPLPVQFMKLIETTMDDSKVATDFVYDEYSRMMQKACEPQATPDLTSTEQIVKNTRHIVKSLNKRGEKFSQFTNFKKLEIGRLNIFADEMIRYTEYQLDHGQSFLNRIMTANSLEPDMVQWGAKLNALKSISCAILSNRNTSINECGELKQKLSALVKKIDSTVSDAIQKKLQGALPIINQTVRSTPV